MHDAFAVGVVEGGRGLAKNAQHARAGEGLGRGEDLFERRPVDVRHRDVGEAVGFVHVVNGDDVGVRENARRTRLAEQALTQFFALAVVVDIDDADGLDGDGAPDGRVFGVIHHTHGATAELTDDLVTADLHPA